MNLVYKCLNPSGIKSDIVRRPLCQRRLFENGKIYLLDIGRPNSDVMIGIAKDMLHESLPEATFVYYCKEHGYQYEESETWWEKLYTDADAVIVFVGDCGSGTMRVMEIQSRLESHGVPTTSFVCEPFVKDAVSVSRNLGMPSLRWTTIHYPITDISDSELKQNLNFALPGLLRTLSLPLSEEENNTDLIPAPEREKYVFQGTFEEVQNFFSEHEMSDGHLIVPPTDEGVEGMLSGTSHKRDEVIGYMPPEFLKTTVEGVAINGYMCGCLPKDMPVLLAIAELLCDKKSGINVSSRSTTGFAFWPFINGPIANEIGMNSGANALGPGNRTNAGIGRAVRMFLINLGGSRVGVNEMATIGNPLKYGFSFAENEEDSPWTPYHVDLGFDPQESTVTLAESWGFRTQGLTSRGRVMGLDNILWSAQNVDSAFGLGVTRGIAVLLDPLLARQLDSRGIGKKDIAEYLWKNLTRTVEEWKNSLSYTVDLRGHLYPEGSEDLPDDAQMPKFRSPDRIHIIVVGGMNSPFYQIFDSVNLHTCSVDKWR